MEPMSSMGNSRKMRYWGWGYEDVVYDRVTTEHALKALVQEFRLSDLPAKTQAIDIGQHTVSESKLQRDFIDRWSNKGLSVDKAQRVIHAVGKSYRDLVRIRSGKIDRYPDGVLFLQDERDLPFLFKEASLLGITLIPFGGGSGVVGGTECVGPSDKPILTINLRRLNQLLSLDEDSLTATFQPGILGPELEEVLNKRGYTLGHFPQSFEFSTLGGWVATRSAGQNSTKYGRIDKLVVSLKAQTPRGVIETRAVPASAAGPSLKEILVGSEGIYGILTEITIQISRLPQTQRFVAAFFKNFIRGIDAVRELMQSGFHPSILRLSDATETALFRKMQPMSGWKEAAFSFWLRMKKAGEAPSLLLLTTEGDRGESLHQESLIRESLQKSGAAVLSKGLSKKIGAKWLKNRFALPYLRDDFMDHSFFIDTLETATLWSELERLHGRMRTVFKEREKGIGEKVLVGCHLSHVYADGASLYFTLMAVQRKNEELQQWNEIKKLATDTIMETGATVSHHHGVGYDHRPWMKQEKTELGLQVLRQIKSQLDPDRLLNPEKTI